MYDGSKVGGTVQRDLWYRILIRLEYALHAVHLRLLPVEIEGEAVRDMVLWWNFGTKAKYWILFVAVIVRENVTDRVDGPLITVHTRAAVRNVVQ